VVYTDYRPTPLQHYIFPAGGEGLHLVVDDKVRASFVVNTPALTLTCSLTYSFTLAHAHSLTALIVICCCCCCQGAFREDNFQLAMSKLTAQTKEEEIVLGQQGGGKSKNKKKGGGTETSDLVSFSCRPPLVKGHSSSLSVFIGVVAIDLTDGVCPLLQLFIHCPQEKIL